MGGRRFLTTGFVKDPFNFYDSAVRAIPCGCQNYRLILSKGQGQAIPPTKFGLYRMIRFYEKTLIK